MNKISNMRKENPIYKADAPYKPYLFSLALIGLSYGTYKGIIDSYLAEVVGMGEFDRGINEFFRELLFSFSKQVITF